MLLYVCRACLHELNNNVDNSMSNKQRIEQHFIPESHPFYKWAMKEAGRAARVWNDGNFVYRSVYEGKLDLIPDYADLVRSNGKILAYDLISRMRELHVESFYDMTKKSSAGQVIILLDQAWRGFRSANASYYEDKSRFNSRPRVPGYKKKDYNNYYCPLIYAGVDFTLKKDGKIFISRDFCLPIRTKQKKIQQVRIVPIVGGVNIEIIYKLEIPDVDSNNERAISIDLGINNFAAITSNIKAPAMLVNGRPLKSINQYYNKKIASIKSKLDKQGLKSSKGYRRITRKRNHKVRDFIHKTSRRIVDFMKFNNIGTCIVGHNTWWKSEVKIGKKNTQNFVFIPHTTFIEKLRYKLEDIGCQLIEIDEAYTSKCSFLDGEKICHHEKYLGKRIKRGLFVSSKGVALNADINGSLNIARKAIGYTYIPDNSIFHPVKLDIETHLSNDFIIDSIGTELVPMIS